MCIKDIKNRSKIEKPMKGLYVEQAPGTAHQAALVGYLGILGNTS